MVIAIPARNEAARLATTLEALARQRLSPRVWPSVQVLVLANNCQDATARVAREWAAGRSSPTLRVEVREVGLPPPEAHVAGARRLALNLAADLAGEGGVIVSTDADTRPQPDWLCGLLSALQHGADAAAGRILLDPAERAALSAPIRRTHLLDCAYRFAATQLTSRLRPEPADPWPRHWQHFGASLALRVSAYRAVGGVPAVPCLEDVALVSALRRADLSVRHTLGARAYTSARLSGRVSVGLSTQLQEWSAGPAQWAVPGAAEIAALARAEAALHLAYEQRRARPGGAAAGLDGLWRSPAGSLRRALDAPTLGEALTLAHDARIAGGSWHGAYPAVPVAVALRELRLALARPERAAAPSAAHSGRSKTSSR